MYAILGCGNLGHKIVDTLYNQNEKFKIIDYNESRVESLKERGFSAKLGDITNRKTLDEFNFSDVDVALILTSNLEANIKATKIIKRLSPNTYTIVRVPKDAEENAKDVDADMVVTSTDALKQYITSKIAYGKTLKKTKELKSLVSRRKKGKCLFVLHNNPDPDSIASALALKEILHSFGVNDIDIGYSGEIGYQENKALVNLLDLNLIPEENVNLDEYARIFLLDSPSPGVNNFLPPKIHITGIIDHHPYELEVDAEFIDIRPEYGSTCTLICEYLQVLSIEISKTLATSLLYGIQSDTFDFTRGSTERDLEVASYLYRLSDQELLEKLRTPDFSTETLEILGKAINNREMYGGYLISNVGYVRNSDALAQVADYLIRLEGTHTTLIFGIKDDGIIVKARSRDIRIDLGEILKKAYGNEHAGGRKGAGAATIPLGLFNSVEEKSKLLEVIDEVIKKRFFIAVGIRTEREGAVEEERVHTTHKIEVEEKSPKEGSRLFKDIKRFVRRRR